MTLETLSEAQERELYRLSRFYWEEARRCEESKAYLAGIAMLGSALEALLMLMVHVHDKEAEASGETPTRGSRPRPLLEWSLSELLGVAKATGWLPHAEDAGQKLDRRKAKIGNYADASRELRNLIHPGRYLRVHSPRRITARYLRQQFEVTLACREWLVYHNNKLLREHLRKEDLNEVEP